MSFYLSVYHPVYQSVYLSIHLPCPHPDLLVSVCGGVHRPAFRGSSSCFSAPLSLLLLSFLFSLSLSLRLSFASQPTPCGSSRRPSPRSSIVWSPSQLREMMDPCSLTTAAALACPLRQTADLNVSSSVRQFRLSPSYAGRYCRLAVDLIHQGCVLLFHELSSKLHGGRQFSRSYGKVDGEDSPALDVLSSAPIHPASRHTDVHPRLAIHVPTKSNPSTYPSACQRHSK